jgi:hypothetical protein
MRKWRSLSSVILFWAVAAAGAPPAPAPMPPSAVIFGNSFNFSSATQVYTAPMNVPQDGAWLYGTARYYTAQNMDCDHHFEVDLDPPSLSPNYSPFLSIGYVSGIDTPCVIYNVCFSCTMNWGGVKPLTYYTTDKGPGWLPAGSGTAVLHTLNGGSVGQIPGDEVTLYLAQVNAVDLQAMTVFEAMRNDFPAPATKDDIDSRAYIAASDDRLPLVPQFTYGTDVYPAPPSATYTAAWDTGQVANVQVTNPYPGNLPGNPVLLVDIPAMKSGNHKVTLTAKLPSGKTFSASPYQVFVYYAALEAVTPAGTMLPDPVTITRGNTATFRLKQQSTKGKVFKITKTDWVFHGPDGVVVNGSSEPGLAMDATEWTGAMHRSGGITVVVTIQAGKLARTSHAALSIGETVAARTDSMWQTVRTLCENCWSDLGIKNGGFPPFALILPTRTNIIDTAAFPTNPYPGITLGFSGEKHVYEDGFIDATGGPGLEARIAPRPFPLYRPFDLYNDPAEWPTRYTVWQIATGPNRDYWYVINHAFHTDWGYAVTSYFDPSSAPGANSAAYTHFVPTGVTGCNQYNWQSCFGPQSLAPCWSSAHGTQSYYQAASTAIDPATGTPYLMSLLVTQVRTHEKQRHWQEFLVDFINAHKAQYDIAPIMESIASRDATEASVRDAIDTFVQQLDFKYAQEPQGGAGEVLNDPKTNFPLIEDTPLSSPPCTFFN